MKKRQLVVIFLILILLGMNGCTKSVPPEPTGYTGQEVLNMASNLATEIENTMRIPEKASIGTKEISIEDSIYLMAKFLALYGTQGTQIGSVPKKVSFLNIKLPESLEVGEKSGEIQWQDIYTLANNLASSLEKNPTLPPKVQFKMDGQTDAYMSLDTLVYVLAEAVKGIKDNNKIPDSIALKQVLAPLSWPVRIKSFWVWGSDLASSGVETILEQLKNMGVTDVFLLVKGTSGTVNWPSQTALAFSSDTTILPKAADYCKKNGMRIHAWFVVNQDQTYANTYTDSKMYSYSGSRAGKTIDFVGWTDYRNYTISLIKEVIQNYDVDGIHLDYIRYPTGAWGWGPIEIQRAKDAGLNIDFLLKIAIETWGKTGDQKKFIDMYKEFRYVDINRWVQMRIDDVRNFVEEIRDVIKEVKPNIILSAALMPEGGDIDPQSNAFAMVHYGQSYGDFADLCEILVPMTYHLDFGKPASWVMDVFKGTKQVARSDTKIIMGIQGYDISPSEMQKAIYLARSAGADGISVFAFHSVFGNEELKKALIEALK